MILSPKLFVDACVARPLACRILAHYSTVYPSLRVVHLTDEYRQSRCDSVWVPQKAQDGGWIIVSSDKGKNKSKPMLPQLCRDYGVTCVLMSNALANMGMAKHQECLHEILRNIEPIYAVPPGTVISLGQAQERGGVVKFAFKINRPNVPQVSLGVFVESLKPN